MIPRIDDDPGESSTRVYSSSETLDPSSPTFNVTVGLLDMSDVKTS